MSLTPSAQMRELICAAAEGKQLKKASARMETGRRTRHRPTDPEPNRRPDPNPRTHR